DQRRIESEADPHLTAEKLAQHLLCARELPAQPWNHDRDSAPRTVAKRELRPSRGDSQLLARVVEGQTPRAAGRSGRGVACDGRAALLETAKQIALRGPQLVEIEQHERLGDA